MERDDKTIKGWRKYKHAFTFGSAARNDAAGSEDNHTPCTCSQEAIGFGCYQSMVDVDALDQQ